MSASFWFNMVVKGLSVISGVQASTFTGAVEQIKLALNTLGDALTKMAAGMTALAIKTAPTIGTLGGAALGAKLGPLGAVAGGGLGMILGKKVQGEYEGMSWFEIWDKIQKEMETKAKTGEQNFVQNNLTNIAKVEIRNQFSENFDADRVAVTLVDQLEKAAQNPLGSIHSNPIKTAGLQTASN